MWWQGHEVTLVCTSPLFFPLLLSLVCQTPSELHTQTHPVKLTHMLKDVFICLPVALERVCMYMCAPAGACVEWRLLLLLSEPVSFLPPCLLAGSTAAWRICLHLIPRPLKSLWHAPGEKKQQQKKTMWGITVLVEEDAGVVYRQCSGSYFPQNTLLFLIRQQIWWKWRLWGSRKTELYLGGWGRN